jgi:hypothetical protein
VKSPRDDAAEPERRLTQLGGVCALFATAALFGALFVGARAAPVQLGSTGGAVSVSGLATQLREYHHHQSLQVMAMALKVAAFVCMLVVIWVLHRATVRRGEASRGWLPVVGAIAALLTIGSSLFGYAELAHVANHFTHGPETTARARSLVSGSSGLRASTLAEISTRLLFALWLGAASYLAGPAGLLTRFLAMFGIAAAAAWGLLIPAGEALFMGWLGSLGLIMLGLWPGGRPEGWSGAPAKDATPERRRRTAVPGRT